ncbi:hypothetical protein [Bacillus sp. B-jedd]|uniref:hypothetical protein n=1 Tax=Bacillus sp. B-jedd TaxID=1476857 RepID=UPI000515724E|nr:hypothetical protein [Bacillus sp. B-jedd]CEG25464.1 hypothetical protein BN1002_00275 [Bacillus sp. B-jedd]
MGKKRWVIGLVIGVLVVAGTWWASIYAKDRKDPLNQSDAFVNNEGDTLTWFVLKSSNGKVTGELLQQKVVEEIGDPPVMEEKSSPVTGEVTGRGYRLTISKGKQKRTVDAWFSEGTLYVQDQGEKESSSYKAVHQDEMKDIMQAKQEKFEYLLYHSEEKEKNRIREFFSDLRSVYGYLASREDESALLFLKIDEALLEGEISGSLLVKEKAANGNNAYKETEYEVNGITDGQIIELFTKIEGKETKLEGNFLEGAAKFDLSNWPSGEKLVFQAVTKEAYKQRSEEYKSAAKK